VSPSFPLKVFKLILGKGQIIAIGAIGLGIGVVVGLGYIIKSTDIEESEEEDTMTDILSDQQTEILANYQSLTGEEDMTRSIQVLKNSNWDLNRALTGTRGNTPGPSSSGSNSVQRRRPAQPTRLIYLPFTLAYRLVTAPFSIGYWMWRFGTGFVGSMLFGSGGNRAPDIDPATEAARFIQMLESHYGANHPAFLNGTYLQAVERARSECKLLVIYLHCELNDNAANFCRNTLCTEVVESFINDNFVSWGSNIKYPQGYQVNNLLSATTYPYIAVLCCNPVVGDLTSSSVGIVDRIEGTTSTDDLIARLYHSLEGYGSLLSNVRTERARRETDRLLRDEQDAAYRQSLLEDQEKERKMREAQERSEREEKERAEREAEEERERVSREQAKLQAREIRRLNIPPESTEKESVLLVVKLPDGKQVRRKFRTADTMQIVLDYVDCSQPEGEELYEYAMDYVLVSNFPGKYFLIPAQH
jgi:FAS-associated factor 2